MKANLRRSLSRTSGRTPYSGQWLRRLSRLRGRQPPLLPWLRGRIRPSTCRDLADES
jgi:hypothetical protein